jgi:replication factor C subunit 2/4
LCWLQVTYTDDGLEAIIFTAQGDMRQVRAASMTCADVCGSLCLCEYLQAVNNLQSTHSGFAMVNADNVFKACDLCFRG